MFREAMLRAFGPINQLFILLMLCMTASLVTSMFGVSLLAKLYGIDLMEDFTVLSRYDEPFVVAANKVMLVAQHLGLFIFPALIFNRLFTFKEHGNFMFGHFKFDAKWLLPSAIAMLAALPLVSALLELNSGLPFSEDIKALEDNAAAFTEHIVAADGIGMLLLNLLIIAVMPAIGEEFIFRGIVQKIGARLFKNIHVGIFVSAFLFSALHFQFYGFIPRMALGMLFGYIAVWGGSIWYAVLAHGINNAFSLIVSYCIGKGYVDATVEEFGASAMDYVVLFAGLVVLAGVIRYFLKNNQFPLYKTAYMLRPKTMQQLLEEEMKENEEEQYGEK